MLGVVELQTGQPVQQRSYGDFALDPGKLSAKAEMDASTERHRPGNVESVRIGINGRVAVGSAKEAQHRLALGYANAAHRHILQGRAPCQLHRRVVPQQLLDGIGDQRRALPK